MGLIRGRLNYIVNHAEKIIKQNLLFFIDVSAWRHYVLVDGWHLSAD